MKTYDFLIVGAGLFGAVFAQQAAERLQRRCLVVERRSHVAGNVYTEPVEGIQVHRYGAHIFHTSNPELWAYVNRFAGFNRFTNAPIANYHGELYNLPFNMNTFYRMWGAVTPDQARAIIERQRREAGIGEPRNLKSRLFRWWAPTSTKSWWRDTPKSVGRPCRELPAFIIKRLPVRFTFDNNYFSDPYQGIPIEGYTQMVERMLADADVRLETDYLERRDELRRLAERVLYTGPIDAYFGYRLGALAYRSVRFETQVLDTPNHQGCAVMNYTDRETPYTRVIEHKHFAFGRQEKTVVSREFSTEWKPGDEPYYPVNDEMNGALYERYRELAVGEKDVLFGGRLG